MSNEAGTRIDVHEVVPRDEWMEKRRELLLREKEFTRARDELSRKRRELPWVKVEKRYLFDGPNGSESLSDVFDGRSQLIVYHFMYPPDWEEGCLHCSFWADHYDAMQVHLNHRDVTFAVISRAPLAKISEFRQRMGWKFTWLSSFHTDFNYDFGASFTPQDVESGTKVFLLQGRDRRDLPHVLDVRTWDRHAQHDIPVARPRAQGPGRRSRRCAELGAPPRPLRLRLCLLQTPLLDTLSEGR